MTPISFYLCHVRNVGARTVTILLREENKDSQNPRNEVFKGPKERGTLTSKTRQLGGPIPNGHKLTGPCS